MTGPADTAREAARRPNGEFGTQQRTEADLTQIDLTGHGARSDRPQDHYLCAPLSPQVAAAIHDDYLRRIKQTARLAEIDPVTGDIVGSRTTDPSLDAYYDYGRAMSQAEVCVALTEPSLLESGPDGSLLHADTLRQRARTLIRDTAHPIPGADRATGPSKALPLTPEQSSALAAHMLSCSAAASDVVRVVADRDAPISRQADGDAAAALYAAVSISRGTPHCDLTDYQRAADAVRDRVATPRDRRGSITDTYLAAFRPDVDPDEIQREDEGFHRR